jgi:2'-5' RNA ligase
VNYFLGFFPDEKTNYKIRKVVGELGRVFEGLEIKVRWVKPEKFHVSAVFLGNDLNFISKSLLGMKLGKYKVPKFEIRFEKAGLGFSKRDRSTVHLLISDGGDELRELVYDLRNVLGINDPKLFIPHLTLGRVNKDLTHEEFKNLTQGIRSINKDLKISEISFIPQTMSFIESNLENFKVLKEY